MECKYRCCRSCRSCQDGLDIPFSPPETCGKKCYQELASTESMDNHSAGFSRLSRLRLVISSSPVRSIPNHAAAIGSLGRQGHPGDNVHMGKLIAQTSLYSVHLLDFDWTLCPRAILSINILTTSFALHAVRNAARSGDAET